MPLEPRKSSLVLVYPAKCFLTQQDFQLPIPVEQIVQNTAPNPSLKTDSTESEFGFFLSALTAIACSVKYDFPTAKFTFPQRAPWRPIKVYSPSWLKRSVKPRNPFPPKTGYSPVSVISDALINSPLLNSTHKSPNLRCSQVGVFWDFGAKKEPRTRLGSWSAGWFCTHFMILLAFSNQIRHLRWTRARVYHTWQAPWAE